MNSQPIGVFDSGLGGLTVVKEIVRLLPGEDVIYLGDTARVPYGTRSPETIRKFSSQDAKFLIGQNVKCIVIACNTSAALAGSELKHTLKVPVLDVVSSTMSNIKGVKSGVIGTRGTIQSRAYKVSYSKACPLLVSFIEEGETHGEALELVIKNYLKEFKSQNINSLILGCTHFPIISELIQKEIGKSIKLVNPGKLVAVSLRDLLRKKKMLNNREKGGQISYFVTDMTSRFTTVASMFLGERLDGKVKKVEIEE